MSHKLQAGTVVYRVIEDGPHPNSSEQLHTWKAAAVLVAQASARRITLERPFPGTFRKIFKPTDFGSFFFETPLQAIRFFLTEKNSEINVLDMKKSTARRAAAWAVNQITEAVSGLEP